MISKSDILIFTDGACTGNPGPGGWGSIIAFPDGTVRELGGGNRDTTNNRMEMVAALRAIAELDSPGPSNIVLYTDSQYLIRGITQWIWGWRNRGWKNSEGKDVANRDLWEELSRQLGRIKPANVEWKYVRGHAGNPGNERCDHIAVSFATGKPDHLYQGPRDGYFVDLSELPMEDPLPDPKKNGTGKSGSNKSNSGKSGGGGPVTYLSYYAGVVTRHSTWADCEKLVKGRNAKFKKAKSAQEEREILISWGLDPATSIE